MTRAEIDTALWDLVRRAQALVSEAHAKLDAGPAGRAVSDGDDVPWYDVAAGWEYWYSDEAAAKTLYANVGNLQNRVLDLNTQVARIVSKRDEDLSQRDVDNVQGYSQLIIDEAKYLGGLASQTSFGDLVRAIVRDLTAFIANVTTTVVNIGAQAVGAGLGGFFNGLGPVGTLVVVGLVWLVLQKRGA